MNRSFLPSILLCLSLILPFFLVMLFWPSPPDPPDIGKHESDAAMIAWLGAHTKEFGELIALIRGDENFRGLSVNPDDPVYFSRPFLSSPEEREEIKAWASRPEKAEEDARYRQRFAALRIDSIFVSVNRSCIEIRMTREKRVRYSSTKGYVVFPVGTIQLAENLDTVASWPEGGSDSGAFVKRQRLLGKSWYLYREDFLHFPPSP